MGNIIEWLKKQYEFRYDIRDEASGIDISAGMLISIFNETLSLGIVGFFIWLFIIRENSREPLQPLFWYVLNPLGLNFCIFLIASLIYIRVRAMQAKSDKSTEIYELVISGLYLYASCAGYFFLRKFDMSFLLLVMPLVMLVLRRNSNYPVALAFLIIIYVVVQVIPVYILGEPREPIPVEANALFGLWIIGSTMYLLTLTKDSTAYSYKKKEEEELKQNAFRKQIYLESHDVRTPIYSIEGMSEMMLRSNVSESTVRDIVVIREAAEDILAALDKVLEASRIELIGMDAQQIAEESNAETDSEDRSGTYLFAPKAHVLVVDDSILNLNVMRALLARTQIKLDCALSGQEALKMVSYNYYDAILLDHMMPEMDGIETLHSIQHNPGANENTPVIVITANDIVGARNMYKREGFVDCVHKPILGEDLEALLEKYLPPHLVIRKKVDEIQRSIVK